MTRQEIANLELETWQASIEAKAERDVHSLSVTVDDLTDAVKCREGTRIVRANLPELMNAKHKLDDLICDLSLFSRAAE